VDPSQLTKMVEVSITAFHQDWQPLPSDCNWLRHRKYSQMYLILFPAGYYSMASDLM
jgi:hypothetical protein